MAHFCVNRQNKFMLNVKWLSYDQRICNVFEVLSQTSPNMDQLIFQDKI